MKILKMLIGFLALLSMAAFVLDGDGPWGLFLLAFSSISLGVLITEEIEREN